MAEALLQLSGLGVRFPPHGRKLRQGQDGLNAVDDVSLVLNRGETLGIVGESGSGKSTLARLIPRIIEPTQGAIRFDGRDITRLGLRELRAVRRQMSMVFQDPHGSLNPRLRVEEVLAEPMVLHGVPAGRRHARTLETLHRVGLGEELLGRFPHQLSGGQRQRVALGRALILEPGLLLADEPTSALDVSVQAQILNLLGDVQQATGLACLLISHDLAVVEYLADTVAVMYRGRIVEQAPADRLFARPRHPYTRELLAAANGRVRAGDWPAPDVELTTPEALLAAPAEGCAFRQRCPLATTECRHHRPELVALAADHQVACLHADAEIPVRPPDAIASGHTGDA